MKCPGESCIKKASIPWAGWVYDGRAKPTMLAMWLHAENTLNGKAWIVYRPIRKLYSSHCLEKECPLELKSDPSYLSSFMLLPIAQCDPCQLASKVFASKFTWIRRTLILNQVGSFQRIPDMESTDPQYCSFKLAGCRDDVAWLLREGREETCRRAHASSYRTMGQGSTQRHAF